MKAGDVPLEVSCYGTSLMIKYAREKGLVERVLDGVIVAPSILENPMEWTDWLTWTQVARQLEIALGGRSKVLISVAEEILRSEVGNFFLFFLRIAPLSVIVHKIGENVEKYSNKNLKVKARLLKDGELEILWIPNEPARYSNQMYDFNYGWTLATLRLKGMQDVIIEDIRCVSNEGKPYSHYKVTWTPRPNIFRRIVDVFNFRVRDQKSIIQHMEENHQSLQKQYSEILALNNTIEASRNFYRHLMENIGEGVIWLDTEGRITYTNAVFCKWLGREAGEFEGRHVWDFMSKKYSSVYYGNRLQKSREQNGQPLTEEYSYITSEKKERIGDTTIISLLNERQQPGFLVSVRDVTEKRRMQQKLEATENRYRSLYENSPAIIIGFDHSGKFMYANRAMEEQSGYTEAELKEMHFGQLVAPGADFNAQRLMDRLTEEARLQEVHFKTKNNEWKSIALNSYPLFDDSGSFIGVAGIGVDVTETKRLNEQVVRSQRMELLGQMAGGLAHDFKNILTSINGRSQFILEEAEIAKAHRNAQIIYQATIRARDLIDKLGTFSRGDMGGSELFDVNTVVSEVADLAIPIVDKGTTVNLVLDTKPLVVKGDPGKLHQCILNLCMNSRDAIGKKEGSITITTESTNALALIKVADTGGGISPDIIEKIFDPFFSTKTKGKGTGLGLSVVYGIVRSHQGNIVVDSRPGEGATFAIELPLAAGEQHDIAALKGSSMSTNGLVMVVDDDNLVREYVAEMLQKKGYATIEFANSEDTLRWFEGERAKSVSYAVLDIILPDIDGVELADKIRLRRPDIRLLFMTGYIAVNIRRPAEGEIVLSKPVDGPMLLNAFNRLSEKRG